jgi:hypothetical protein
MSVKPGRGGHGTIFRQPGGDAWILDDKGSFWGPYAAWKEHGSARHPSYFGALAQALLDAAEIREKVHAPPPGFPFPLLGQPAMEIYQGRVGYPRNQMDIIACGSRLDRLALRLRLLVAEAECFTVQKALRQETR